MGVSHLKSCLGNTFLLSLGSLPLSFTPSGMEMTAALCTWWACLPGFRG